MTDFELGSAEITPTDAVAAGSNRTIVFTYTAGHPIDDSGYVKIAFQQVCDFGEPQFDDPTAPNYCTVSTTGDCRIFPRYDPKGNLRPWSKALYLQIRFGYLDEGDQIRVVFGDQTGGSPGWRVQSFCEQRFVFRTFVDPIATYSFKELPSSPWFEIVAGAPVRAVCIAPAQVTVAQPFRYHLKLEDLWGNPIAEPRPIEHPGFETADIKVMTATDPDTGLSAQSNPVEVVADATGPGRFWADFHGQSEETIGTNPIEHYFRFGRDFALLDILGHQGNDFQVTDMFWKKINRLADETCVPGRFVTFPGYEWSANTPLGGDRNVYFNGPGGKITRSSCELLPGRESRFPDSPT
ncbi:MAG: DUF3604 domain-containing protein, partial [Lentisphaeria bacterium]|nr:DUF3604 domain-containing protein [Lentisphaeria bacterium]